MPEIKSVKISAGSDIQETNAAPVNNKHDAFWNRAHQGGALMLVRNYAMNYEQTRLRKLFLYRIRECRQV